MRGAPTVPCGVLALAWLVGALRGLIFVRSWALTSREVQAGVRIEARSTRKLEVCQTPACTSLEVSVGHIPRASAFSLVFTSRKFRNLGREWVRHVKTRRLIGPHVYIYIARQRLRLKCRRKIRQFCNGFAEIWLGYPIQKESFGTGSTYDRFSSVRNETAD